MATKNKFINSYVEINIEGLNFEKLFFYFKRNGIELYNVDRPEYNLLSFFVTYADYKKIKKLKALKNYKVLSINKKGAVNFFKNYKLKIGLLVGVFVSVLGFSVLSLFTFKINVLGAEGIKESLILKELENINIKTGKINLVNNYEIELYLKKQFDDISLVSVVKRGTNIIINIKEKEKLQFNSANEIIAPYNGIIEKLIINQGTALKKVGDIVLKGEAIIAPYVLNEKNERMLVDPIAEIELDVWYVGAVEFETRAEEFIRTGKTVVNSRLKFLNFNISSKSKDVNFTYYELDIYDGPLFYNLFLPINLFKEKYYETKLVIKEYSFDDNKDELIKKSSEIAHSKVPENSETTEEAQIITNTGTKYYVQTYVRTKLIIKTN